MSALGWIWKIHCHQSTNQTPGPENFFQNSYFCFHTPFLHSMLWTNIPLQLPCLSSIYWSLEKFTTQQLNFNQSRSTKSKMQMNSMGFCKMTFDIKSIKWILQICKSVCNGTKKYNNREEGMQLVQESNFFSPSDLTLFFSRPYSSIKMISSWITYMQSAHTLTTL